MKKENVISDLNTVGLIKTEHSSGQRAKALGTAFRKYGSSQRVLSNTERTPLPQDTGPQESYPCPKEEASIGGDIAHFSGKAGEKYQSSCWTSVLGVVECKPDNSWKASKSLTTNINISIINVWFRVLQFLNFNFKCAFANLTIQECAAFKNGSNRARKKYRC